MAFSAVMDHHLATESATATMASPAMTATSIESILNVKACPGSTLEAAFAEKSQKSFHAATSVITTMKTMGTSVTQMYFALPIFKRMVVPTHRARAASSWFATPNIGQMVDTLPELMSRPHARTTAALVATTPGIQSVLPRGLYTCAPNSWSMNRATLVPASTVVRMKSASNMSAKLYQ